MECALATIDYGDFDWQFVWLRGWDTSTFHSDKVIGLGVVQCVETQDYVTVLGATERVVVIEPLDLTPYYAEYRSRVELADVRVQAPPEVEPADPEAAAAAKLGLAKSLIEAGQITGGRKFLTDILADFPGRAAADEASTLLEGLQ